MSLPKKLFQFDLAHRPCRCIVCVHARLLRMLHDLDEDYRSLTMEELAARPKDRIQ